MFSSVTPCGVRMATELHWIGIRWAFIKVLVFDLVPTH